MPSIRNCPISFLRDILCGRKRFFLQREVAHITVPKCPELTIEKVLAIAQQHDSIMQYIPDLKDEGNQYIERQFLFTVVNTCDREFSRSAIAELEQRRSIKVRQDLAENYVEIDQSLLNLIEKI